MTPGDELAAVRAKHPCWRIWVGNEGGCYATRPGYSALAAGASVTVYGATPAELDAAITAAEAEYEQAAAARAGGGWPGRWHGMAELVAVLAAGDPLAQAFSQALWLARLQRRHPCYDVWLDQRYGRDARYVAQRKPGASGRPYAVVTTDPAELDAALARGGCGTRSAGSPDQRIGG